MRRLALLLAAIATLALTMGALASVSAGGLRNRGGCGIYSPEELPTRRSPGVYRYDDRSWCYKTRGYYPYYNSGYWVPRGDMRYRYRYVYYGPQYRYFPAWGYGW